MCPRARVARPLGAPARARGEDPRVDPLVSFLEHAQDRWKGSRRLEPGSRHPLPREDVLEDDGARTETFCGGYLRYDPAPVRRAAHVNDEIECSGDLLAEVRHGKVHIGHQGHGLES